MNKKRRKEQEEEEGKARIAQRKERKVKTKEEGSRCGRQELRGRRID